MLFWDQLVHKPSFRYQSFEKKPNHDLSDGKTSKQLLEENKGFTVFDKSQYHGTLI
jgi:hypothetical protein